jgi:hypothetical protein
MIREVAHAVEIVVVGLVVRDIVGRDIVAGAGDGCISIVTPSVPVVPRVVKGQFEPACRRSIDEQFIALPHFEAAFVGRHFRFTAANDQL